MVSMGNSVIVNTGGINKMILYVLYHKKQVKSDTMSSDSLPFEIDEAIHACMSLGQAKTRNYFDFDNACDIVEFDLSKSDGKVIFNGNKTEQEIKTK